MSYPVAVRPCRSDHVDLFGLWPLDALTGGELDPLVFLQAAEAASLDGGVVNEKIGSAVVGGSRIIFRAPIFGPARPR
jgi:hypothetical protein